ncbi:MAG TPA: hypothetical protein VMS93_03420, partial [Candidatus Saccharimonadales bacterium]|nr:hypothetical protein [Candidatus Saccharimonadales bacterium]
MRILFLSDGPRVPLVTGDRLRNWRLVECLARRHHVAWWSLLEPGATAGAAPAGVEEASLAVPPGWQEPGTKLRKWLCAPFSSDPLLVLGLPLQGPGAEIARAAAGFDVLHCAHLITWRAVPESLAPRCVVDLCDSMSLRYELLLRNSPGVRLRDRSLLAYTLAGQAGRLRRYERSMPARAGAALVVAARDREHLRAPELHVVPNGVDTAYFRRSGPREPGRLVFFGNLRYGPNADAAARLARETLPAVGARG